MTEKIDITSKGDIVSPVTLNPVEQREKVQQASAIKKNLTPKVNNPSDLYKAYKTSRDVQQAGDIESAIDSSNNEIVGSYLSYLENLGTEESLSKKNQKQSEWNALNEALSKGDLNTSQMKHYRSLVGEAVNHYNEPRFQEISDIKSRYDIDGFYNMLSGIENVTNPAERQAKINAARAKTGVTEEVQMAFENASDEVIDPLGSYQSFSKRFKDLGDLESTEERQLERKTEFKKALDQIGIKGSKTAVAAMDLIEGIAAVTTSMASGVAKAPRAFGSEEYGWTDKWASSVQSLTDKLEGELGRNEDFKDLPTYMRLSRLLGEGAGSMGTMMLGGSMTQGLVGTGSKMANFAKNTGVWGTAYLSQLDDNLQEGLDLGLTFDEARRNAQVNSMISATVEMLVPEGASARASFKQLIKEGVNPMKAAAIVIQDFGKGSLKEGFEELAENVSVDIAKSIEDPRYQVFDIDSYMESMISGMLVGGGAKLFSGTKPKHPDVEQFKRDAAERAILVSEDASIEGTDTQVAEAAPEVIRTAANLSELKKSEAFNNLDEVKQNHVLTLQDQIQELEEIQEPSPMDKAHLQRLQAEKDELLSLGENGIDPKQVGIATKPQRVMTNDGQAHFFINEDGDYEIEYNNGRSIVVDKGEGAPLKLAELGVRTGDGVAVGGTLENRNILVTPKIEKGATVTYGGKNAILNKVAEKNGEIIYANITTEDGRTLQIREGQKGDAQELLENLTRANKGEEQVFLTKEDIKQVEKSAAPEVVSGGSATPTTVESTEVVDLPQETVIGKADAPTKESVTEMLNINNPFYKKVEDALVKLGLIEKYNPKKKTGDVVGGYVQPTSDGGFSAGRMMFSQNGDITYFDGNGNRVSFDKNGNVISENTKEASEKNKKIEIEGKKESIANLEKTRDSENFKYKEVTETDRLGNRKKVRRLKTAQELKESTDKINSAIDKAKSELATLEGKKAEPTFEQKVEATAKALEEVRNPTILDKVVKLLGGSKFVNKFRKRAKGDEDILRIKEIDDIVNKNPTSRISIKGDEIIFKDGDSLFDKLIDGGFTEREAFGIIDQIQDAFPNSFKEFYPDSFKDQNVEDITSIIEEEYFKRYINNELNKESNRKKLEEVKKRVEGLKDGEFVFTQKSIDFIKEVISGIENGDVFLFTDSQLADLGVRPGERNVQNVDSFTLAEAYHKAKKDGSNPELVKAVEDLLGTPSKTQTPTEAGEAQSETLVESNLSDSAIEPEVTKVENSRESAKAKVDAIAEKLKEKLKAKGLPDGVQSMGFDGDIIIDGLANLTKQLIDLGYNVKEAIGHVLDAAKDDLSAEEIKEAKSNLEARFNEGTKETLEEEEKATTKSAQKEGEDIPSLFQDIDETGRLRSKTMPNRIYNGTADEKTKDIVQKLGLNRRSREQKVVEQNVLDFIERVGLEQALGAVRDGMVTGDSAILICGIVNMEAKKRMMASKSDNDSKKEEAIQNMIQDSITLWQGLNVDAGSASSMNKFVYENYDIGYKLNKQISQYKAENYGHIPEDVEERLREADRVERESKKRIAELEQQLREKQAQEAIDAIIEEAQTSIEIENKKTFKEKSKDLAKRIRKVKLTRPSVFASAAPADMVWKKAVETVATEIESEEDVSTEIEAEKRFIDAVKAGVDYIKKSDWYKGLDDQNKKKVEGAFSSEMRKAKGFSYIDSDGNAIIPYSAVKELVSQGYNTPQSLIEKIREQLGDDSVSDRVIRDIITGYGKEASKGRSALSKDIAKIKTAMRLASRLEDAENGVIKAKTPKKAYEISDEIIILRARIKQLTAGIPVNTDSQSVKNNLKQSLADYEQRLEQIRKTGKEPKKKVKTSVEEDSEIKDLRAKLRDAKEVYSMELLKVKEKNMRSISRWWREVAKTSNIFRAVHASLELSYVLVQGRALTFHAMTTKPKVFAKAVSNMYKSLVSEEGFETWENDVKSHPLYDEMVAAGVALPDLNSGITKGEEAFMRGYTDWLWENIPTATISLIDKEIGKEAREAMRKVNLFSKTERAGVAYLNTLRIARYEDGRTILVNQGKSIDTNPVAFKNLASVINTWSGRASLGKKLDSSQEALSLIFYAARNWMSIIRQTTPVGLIGFLNKTDIENGRISLSAAQKVAMGNWAASIGASISMLAMLAMYFNNDDDEETSVNLTDPTSSDFLKIKIGDTRTDVLGGQQQMIVLQSRWYHGYSTSSSGKRRELKGYPLMRWLEPTMEMLPNKLSPVASIIYSAGMAEKKYGVYVDKFDNPFTITDKVIEYLTPMYWGGVPEVWQEHSPQAAAGMATIGYFGMGSSIYGSAEERADSSMKMKLYKAIHEDKIDMPKEYVNDISAIAMPIVINELKDFSVSKNGLEVTEGELASAKKKAKLILKNRGESFTDEELTKEGERIAIQEKYAKKRNNAEDKITDKALGVALRKYYENNNLIPSESLKKSKWWRKGGSDD